MSSAPFPEWINHAFHEIGNAADGFTDAGARKAAADFIDARHQMPQAEHSILVGGFDSDPRELWDIPEAKDFVRRFAGCVMLMDPRPLNEWRLDSLSTALIAVCIGLGRVKGRHPVTGAWTFEIGKPP